MFYLLLLDYQIFMDAFVTGFIINLFEIKSNYK